METQTLRQFIAANLTELGDIVIHHPYQAFVSLAALIELFGKCFSTRDLHKKGHSKNDFDKAIKKLSSLQKYESVNLYSLLRCGLLHAYLPKKNISLAPMHNDLSCNQVGCQDLYQDICTAWEDINNKRVLMIRDIDQNALSVDNDVSGSTIN